MLLLITYELSDANKDYKPFYNAIKSAGSSWWHYLDNTWIINASMSPRECSNLIRPYLEDKDHLLVVDITNQARQGWLPSKAWEWLRNNE